MKIGNITFVEGIWGVGKSTYIEHLVTQSRGVYIKEPSHLSNRKLTTRVNFTDWYRGAHYQDLERAVTISKSGKNVFIERSPLSAIVFKIVFLKNSLDLEKELIIFNKKMAEIKGDSQQSVKLDLIVQEDISKTISVMQNNPYLSDLADEQSVTLFQEVLIGVLSRIDRENIIIKIVK